MDFGQGKDLLQSLTSTDPMQHSVYNHTLMSPHQVSISRAMPLHQCSRLIGGSQTVGTRVVDSLPNDAVRGKDGQKVPYNSESVLTDLLAMPSLSSSRNSVGLHSTCTSTLQTHTSEIDNDDDKSIHDDDDESENDDDDCSNDSDEDSDIENFIQIHLARKKEASSKRVSKQPPVSEQPSKMNINVHTMKSFIEKTDELIKHNLLLQQQISTLKRETSLQTKVLTKLLVKRSKKNKKSPSDEDNEESSSL